MSTAVSTPASRGAAFEAHSWIRDDLQQMRSKIPGHTPPVLDHNGFELSVHKPIANRAVDRRAAQAHTHRRRRTAPRPRTVDRRIAHAQSHTPARLPHSPLDPHVSLFRLHGVTMPASWEAAPRFSTRSELRRKRAADMLPHPSFDIDGDKFVGQLDYAIAKRHDADSSGTRSLLGPHTPVTHQEAP